MSQSSMTFSLQGSAEMERRLRTLRDGAAARIVSSALRAAARPIVAAARRNARVSKSGKRYGGLSKSIGSVIRNYRATQKVIAVIGPQHGKVVMREGRREAPALIAHLVEFGHRIAVGGELPSLPGSKHRTSPRKRSGVHRGWVEAQPFLRPAFDSQRAAAQQTLENKLREGVEREAARG